MNGQEKITEREADEIAEIARRYMLLPESAGLQRLQCNIDRALTDGDWDDLGKWHRVRLRLQRMCEERRMAERFAARA